MLEHGKWTRDLRLFPIVLRFDVVPVSETRICDQNIDRGVFEFFREGNDGGEIGEVDYTNFRGVACGTSNF